MKYNLSLLKMIAVYPVYEIFAHHKLFSYIIFQSFLVLCFTLKSKSHIGLIFAYDVWLICVKNIWFSTWTSRCFKQVYSNDYFTSYFGTFVGNLLTYKCRSTSGVSMLFYGLNWEEFQPTAI